MKSRILKMLLAFPQGHKMPATVLIMMPSCHCFREKDTLKQLILISKTFMYNSSIYFLEDWITKVSPISVSFLFSLQSFSITSWHISSASNFAKTLPNQRVSSFPLSPVLYLFLVWWHYLYEHWLFLAVIQSFNYGKYFFILPQHLVTKRCTIW